MGTLVGLQQAPDLVQSVDGENMSIKFTYEIISVDPQARCMEVVYRADGYETQHIGVRLPFEGESLEQVVLSFAPIPHWEALSRQVVAPAVGSSGEIDPATTPVSGLFVEQTIA